MSDVICQFPIVCVFEAPRISIFFACGGPVYARRVFLTDCSKALQDIKKLYYFEIRDKNNKIEQICIERKYDLRNITIF